MRVWLQEAITGRPAKLDPDTPFSVEARNRLRKYRVSELNARIACPLLKRTHQRILILSGPAGAGKTTTARVLAKELDLDVLEWDEDVDDAAFATEPGAYQGKTFPQMRVLSLAFSASRGLDAQVDHVSRPWRLRPVAGRHRRVIQGYFTTASVATHELLAQYQQRRCSPAFPAIVARLCKIARTNT